MKQTLAYTTHTHATLHKQAAYQHYKSNYFHSPGKNYEVTRIIIDWDEYSTY